MLTGERLKFKHRKGQWRRRTILHIEDMLRGGFKPTCLEMAAKLARAGWNGEMHLKDAIVLDFSDNVVHDIRMMLLSIASVGRVWRGVTGDANAPVYDPPDAVWEEKKLYYAVWNIRTRRQFNKFMEALGKLQ